MRNIKDYVVIGVTLALLVPGILVVASTSDGTIDSSNKYAWSENGGWINFGTSGGNVHVTDGALSGYAWSDNYGWINLSPAGSGVKNNSNGGLSGSAWAENAGWINFSGVSINSSGQFTGTASSENLGTISFNCSECTVTTDWRPASSRGGGGSGSGSTTYNQPLPAPTEGFSISINSGSEVTNSATVTLTLVGGTATTVELSNFSDMHDAAVVTYASSMQWVLSQGDGQKIVYARFRAGSNLVSPIVSDSIALDTSTPDLLVNAFTEFWSDQNVVLTGVTTPYGELTFAYDELYGYTRADEAGAWKGDFGPLSVGSHQIDITVKSQAGNSRTVSVTVISKQRPPEQPQTKPEKPETKPQGNTGGNSLFDKIQGAIDTLLDKQKPQGGGSTVIIPKQVPLVLQGKWKLIKIFAYPENQLIGQPEVLPGKLDVAPQNLQ